MPVEMKSEGQTTGEDVAACSFSGLHTPAAAAAATAEVSKDAAAAAAAAASLDPTEECLQPYGVSKQEQQEQQQQQQVDDEEEEEEEQQQQQQQFDAAADCVVLCHQLPQELLPGAPTLSMGGPPLKGAAAKEEKDIRSFPQTRSR